MATTTRSAKRPSWSPTWRRAVRRLRPDRRQDYRRRLHRCRRVLLRRRARRQRRRRHGVRGFPARPATSRTRAATRVNTAADYRAMWDTIERLWSDIVARAERLPEPALDERVERGVVLRRDAAPSRVHHRLLGEPYGPRPADPYHGLRVPQLCAGGRSGAGHRPRRASVVRRVVDGARRPYGAGARHRRRSHGHRARTDVHACACNRLSRGIALGENCVWVW